MDKKVTNRDLLNVYYDLSVLLETLNHFSIQKFNNSVELQSFIDVIALTRVLRNMSKHICENRCLHIDLDELDKQFGPL